MDRGAWRAAVHGVMKTRTHVHVYIYVCVYEITNNIY